MCPLFGGSTVYNQYIKILVVCLCVRDGCGRGRNEFAVRVQNHHVLFSFHRNGLEMLQVWTLGYAKDAIVGACHCTSDGQEHKIIWRAGPERERIFHLRVTACIEQGSHCRHERLAWVASR